MISFVAKVLKVLMVLKVLTALKRDDTQYIEAGTILQIPLPYRFKVYFPSPLFQIAGHESVIGLRVTYRSSNLNPLTPKPDR